ncbi:NAD(P)/FAD-dependent oxidoreductase [Streptomyces sp. NPDC048473]|uniref:NAD(P)/FAD-dependent oxidoreductase n=1 Tax=unclassified Streptomyces TaxID=2593676 RepID=UPI0037196129
MSNQSTTKEHVLVVGAGYAGLRAALNLAPHVRVTLIDPADRFTERVRLHEKATGRPDVTHSLRTFLRPAGVTHIPALITRIDTASAEVHTDTGRVLGYDRLVYALGSRTAGVGGPGASDERVYTAESAAELHKRLLDGPGSLAVVGGGLTGIELATELAEFQPRWQVQLITGGEIAPSVSDKARAHIRSVLVDRGVRIEEHRRVNGPQDIDADVVVWSASMVPNTELAIASGLDVEPRGQIRVNSALRSVSHPGIYVAGDAAAAQTPSSGPIRMACATALPLGAHAAASVVRDLRGEDPKPLQFSYTAQCISLGRHDGMIQLVREDDSPRDLCLTGKPAAMVKEQVVRNTVRTLRVASRSPRAAGLLPGN